MFQFSSDVVRPRDRFEVWVDFLNRTLAPFRTEPAGEHPFHVESGMQAIGALPLVSIIGAGYRGARGRPEIARSPEHFYVAAIHIDGKASFTCRGKETHLAQGDVFVLDTMHEVEFGLERPYHHLLVKLPKAWVDARLPRPECLCGSILSHDHPIGRLFTGYAVAGFQTAGDLSPSAATLFSQHLIDLLCEAFAESQLPYQPAHSQAVRAAMFVRACRLIALRFSEPDLRPDLIAEQLGVSTRTLNRIFSGEGETVMQHLMKERISAAAKLLASEQARSRTITDIAFACGFNDLTHFSRVFGDEMDMTPSKWRSEHGR
ncbi:helix-turn-helix domain-containing protein [Lysobacter sp. Root559]|uniref:helix-turn-helix domain-containing protein n=1 Tax=Lysobacter sp. Root559 TaxID=1736559 RepID=UPI0009EC7A7D|nr:helix-turn-helix domain-containing protein [Lysobacter sp. Root559]